MEGAFSFILAATLFTVILALLLLLIIAVAALIIDMSREVIKDIKSSKHKDEP
jgi:hypothetical protein